MSNKQQRPSVDDVIDKLEPKRTPAQRLSNRALPPVGIRLAYTYEFLASGPEDALTAELSTDTTANVTYALEAMHSKDAPTTQVSLGGRATVGLPPGVTIIIGRSGAGKTKLALERLVSLNKGVTYARFGEPLDHRFSKALQAQGGNGPLSLLTFEVDLATQIANHLLSEDSRVMVVDSLRYLFYAGGGATGKGGVNMTLFADISHTDVAVSQCGKSLVVIINPLTDDDASYKSIIEAAKGSVSALIDVKSPTSIRYTSRYEEREWRDITLSDSVGVAVQEQKLGGQSATATSLRNYTK